jgi:hypothetical protein
MEAMRNRNRSPSTAAGLAGPANAASLGLLMEPKAACLQVLEEAAPEALHWTVVLDRALQARLLDPFTQPDVRGAVVKSLATLAKQGTITKQSTGVYRARQPAGEGR